MLLGLLGRLVPARRDALSRVLGQVRERDYVEVLAPCEHEVAPPLDVALLQVAPRPEHLPRLLLVRAVGDEPERELVRRARLRPVGLVERAREPEELPRPRDLVEAVGEPFQRSGRQESYSRGLRVLLAALKVHVAEVRAQLRGVEVLAAVGDQAADQAPDLRPPDNWLGVEALVVAQPCDLVAQELDLLLHLTGRVLRL